MCFDSSILKLAFSGGRNLAISRGQSMLDTSHGLLIIPGREGDVKIGVESLFSTPLYWSAPDIFLSSHWSLTRSSCTTATSGETTKGRDHD